ncbi:MAG: NAD(P)/FAD-dependent oxidoreductase [Burkholderiales bacterium]|nr:NAD(P)/FAD-dependent oxidoreductase [Burkholderiales bacterium]
MHEVDVAVVGAGVVGLAIAREMAQRGLETLVLESQQAIGTGASSRNSEVIHAGLYYPEGSLKARLCVQGKQRLYEFCESHGVAHQRCGKLLVATDDEQLPALDQLMTRAATNGVHDLQWLSATQAMALEPQLACTGAIVSPSTGIIDSHGLMLALQGDLQRAGGVVALSSPVHRISCGAGGHVLHVGGQDPTTLAAGIVVNAAGLWAPLLAQHTEGLNPALVPRARFCKGSYYALAGRTPFSRLIYPLPQDAWLGVHLTLDLGGQARFGPDVQWLPDAQAEPLDYAVEPSRANVFYAAVRRYWPGLPDGALLPAYSGIRPKIHACDEPAPDFLIQGPQDHGIEGLVNLFGIESPGLTSCLALADEVADRLA